MTEAKERTQMKIKLKQWDSKRRARVVELRECFPNDEEGRRELQLARQQLEQFGYHEIGGGAAPMFRMYRV